MKDNSQSLDSSSIVAAAVGNDLERVRHLVEQGAEVDALNERGESAVHIAVRRGFDDLALALLELEASPDVAADDGWTALQRASNKAHLELMRSLLEAGADPNLAPPQGEFPLRRVINSRASKQDRSKALDLLLSAGANPDLVTEPTLLFTCTVAYKKRPEYKELLARLLEAGASDVPNQYGWTAAMVARWMAHEPIAEMLPEDDASEALRLGAMAAIKGDEESLNSMLDDGLDLESTDPSGTSLLATCCTRRHWSAAEMLLARGADPLATGSNGYNPAALCYLRARTDLMWSMFDTAGEVNDAAGTCRALVNAVGAGDLETARRLLERGANPDSADTESQSCLLLAVAKKHMTVASLLLEHGADPNTGAGTKTALDYSVEARDAEFTRKLLDKGADPNGNEISSALWPLIDPFHASGEASVADLALLLLDHGASLNVSDKKKLERLGIQRDEEEAWGDRLRRWFREGSIDEEAAREQESEKKAAREREARVLQLREDIERLGGTLPPGWDAQSDETEADACIIGALGAVEWPTGLRVTTEGTPCAAYLTNATLYQLREFPDGREWMGDDRPYGLLADDLDVQKMLLVALDDTSTDPTVFVMDHDGEDNPPSVSLSELFSVLSAVPAPSQKEAEGEPPRRHRAGPLAEVLEQRRVYLIERCDDIDGLNRIGGLPPALSEDGWPEFDGLPMLHVATLDVRNLDLGFEPPSAAVSVFTHSVTELEAFEPGSGLTHVAWLTEEDLGQDVHTPEGVEILEARGCRVCQFCTIELGADLLIARFPEEFGADDIEQSVIDSPTQDAWELLGDLLADEGQPSYVGGWAYNPSSLGPGEQPEDASEEGPFVMRLRESLVGDANFAGGGWLFVHQRDAWAEQ